MSNQHSVAMQLIRRALLQNTSIVNAVEDRVHLDHFYSYEAQNTVMPAIIIDPRGGRAASGKSHQRLQIDIYVYDKQSAGRTEKIYDILYEALNCVRLYHSDTAQAGYCKELFRPLSGYNNEIKAYFRRGTFVYYGAG